MLFGAIVLWEVCRYLRYGWIGTFYVSPRFHFTYFGFGWIAPWPGDGMYVHFVALGLLAGCVALGLWYRVTAPLVFVGFTYVFLLDEAQYLNHWYLLCLMAFLLVLVPAHRAFSLDAWRTHARRTEVVPAWTLWLLRAQLGIVYVYAGLAKLNADWLRGEPLGSWLAAEARFPIVGGLFTERWFVLLVAYASLLLDLFITPLLLWRRTFLPAFGAVVAFHLLNWRLFGLGIFPWFMIGATFVLFVPADWLRRWLRLPAFRAGVASDEGGRALRGLVVVYLAVQLLLPLRHYAYPGDVNWTEEGHRFAWHMMLREKTADVGLWAVDPFRARAWPIDLWRYVTPRQRQAMSADPDMIQQLSRHVGDDLRRRGDGRVRVHALVRASLHGRAPQWLIDPRVDLAAVPRTLSPVSWIVPLGQADAVEWPVAMPERHERAASAAEAEQQTAVAVLAEAFERRREREHSGRGAWADMADTLTAPR